MIQLMLILTRVTILTYVNMNTIRSNEDIHVFVRDIAGFMKMGQRHILDSIRRHWDYKDDRYHVPECSFM